MATVCFYSTDMETILDPSLSPRYGGAEWRTYITARALAADPGCRVSLAVDAAPCGERTHEGIPLHLIPQTPLYHSAALTLLVKSLRRLKALTTTGAERSRRFENIRKDPPINVYGVLENHAPTLYERLLQRRWDRLLRATRSEWQITWGSSWLCHQVVQASRRLHKRSAIWLSSDIDIDWDRPDVDDASRERYLWALRNADLVLAQHEGQREALAAVDVESEILPTGIEIKEDTGRETRDCILWVASCQRLKQPGHFVELARRLPHIPHVMVMTRRPWAAEYFDEIAKEAEHVPNLRILDGVPDVRPYYDRAAALVNMSPREGFPTTFLEAAISSTPAIALHVDPDGMLSGGTGFTCGGDFELLVRTVEELYHDAEARRRMGAAARAYLVEHHDIAHVAERLKMLMH